MTHENDIKKVSGGSYEGYDTFITSLSDEISQKFRQLSKSKGIGVLNPKIFIEDIHGVNIKADCKSLQLSVSSIFSPRQSKLRF